MIKYAMSLVCLVAALLSGCSGEDDPQPEVEIEMPSVERVTVSGRLVLPPGVEAAEVANAIGAARVEDGEFSIEAFEAGPTLAFAVSSSGEPIAAGWLDPGEDDNVIDVRSSAEVAAFYGLAAPLAAANLVPEVVEQLAEALELDAVAEAWSEALGASPEGLGDTDERTSEALREAVEALLAVARFRVQALTINPPGARSGIRLDQLGGVNELTIVNTYRRRAYAYIDRVSIVTENGEERSPKAIKDLPIEPIVGTDGATGTLSQILNATQEPGGFFGSENVAHVPRTFGPFSLPNVSGAKRTNYRVAIVGPGSTAGDVTELSVKELDKLDEVSLEFVGKDILLPFVLNVAVPETQLDQYMGHPLANSVTGDIVRALATQYPAVKERLRTGDVSGVVTELITALGGSSTLRDVIIDSIREHFYDFSTAAGDAAFSRASTLADRFAKVTGSVDLLGTLLETGVLLYDTHSSEQANVWTVVATDAVIRLEPRVSRLQPGEFVTLRVQVVDAENEEGFEYRFSTSGEAGTLQSAITRGNAITSSVNAITYDATMAGKDEVRVDVYQTGSGADELIGTALAEVSVEGARIEITPTEPEVDPYGTLQLTATLATGDAPAQVLYRWSVAGEGTLGGERELEETVEGEAAHSVEFRAGLHPGPQTVTVEALEPREGGAPRLLAEASIEVEVKPWQVRIAPATSALDPGAEVSLTATVVPAPPEGTLDFAWAIAEGEGLLDGAPMVNHSVSDSNGDTVVYQAPDDPAACAQRIELMTTLTVGDETLELRAASAVIRIGCDDSAVTLTAAFPLIFVSRTGEVRAEVAGAPVGELSYRWSLSLGHGTLLVTAPDPPYARTPAPSEPIAASMVTYAAPATPGTEEVEVTVLLDDGSGPTEIGTASTSITSADEIDREGRMIVNVGQNPNDFHPDCRAFTELPNGCPENSVYLEAIVVCPDLFGAPFYRVETERPAYSHTIRGSMGNSCDDYYPAQVVDFYAPPFCEGIFTGAYDSLGIGPQGGFSSCLRSPGERWVWHHGNCYYTEGFHDVEELRAFLSEWRVHCYGSLVDPGPGIPRQGCGRYRSDPLAGSTGLERTCPM